MVYLKLRFILFCLLIVTSGCSITTSCSADPNCVRILFIGNSYTYVNDLPAMFTSLAKSGGHRVETGMVAEGGLMLADHVKSATTLDALKSSKWNFVVLQEQSQIPSIMQVRNLQMYPPARTLVSLIRENGAQPIFFLTWAHRDGWPEQGMSSYESMQQNIDDGYMSIVHELNTRVAPVGVAWSDALSQNPQVSLWQADGSHPSLQGTYLAACVFYAVVFQESPEGLSYKNDLSKAEAQWLQKIAAETVLNNKAEWNIP